MVVGMISTKSQYLLGAWKEMLEVKRYWEIS